MHAKLLPNSSRAPRPSLRAVRSNPSRTPVVVRATGSDTPADNPGEDMEKISAEFLQLGMWRLRGRLSPPIEALCARVEGIIREVQGVSDFEVVKLPKQFEYADSLDPKRELPFIYLKKEGPAKGEAGYPRLQLENRCYSTRVFEKIHLELAVRQDGLQVFHCVFFPRPQYAFPILGMDVVAMAQEDGSSRVSLAIVDPSPVSWDLSLPEWYQGAVNQLQTDYSTTRQLPGWGKEIFSSSCVAVRPTSGEELASFIKYACALTRVHMMVAKTQEHLVAARPQHLPEIKASLQRYCEMQLKNDKTRRVLEASFGSQFADEYMTTVMFPAAAAGPPPSKS